MSNKSNKMICPACKGNGYRMVYKDASWYEKTPIDCEYCNNQGEIDEEIKNPNELRIVGAI
jgi:DnaJ-class molecular chaperone